MRALALGLLLFALAVGPVARAEQDPAVAVISAHLDDGEPTKALEVLTPEVRERLSKVPKDARDVCAEVAANVRWITRKAFDPAEVEALVDAVIDLGQRTVRRNEATADAHRANAYAVLTQGRFRDAAGYEPAPEDWEKAAQGCLDAWIRRRDDRYVAAASSYLLEASKLPGAPAAELRSRAAEVCEKALENHRDVPDLKLAVARVAFAEAEACLAERKKKEARAAWERALSILEPITKLKVKPGRASRTTYNTIVSFMRANKVGKKPDFITFSRLTRWRYIQMEIPSGFQWRVKDSTASKTQLLTTLTRYDRGGGRTRIRISRYKYGSDYEVGRHAIGHGGSLLFTRLFHGLAAGSASSGR